MHLSLFGISVFSIENVSLHAEAAAYLFRVHGRGANGVNNHHVGPSVGVHQITAVPLPQRVHHARLVQVLQGGQVFQPLQRRRVRLECKVSRGRILTNSQLELMWLGDVEND